MKLPGKGKKRPRLNKRKRGARMKISKKRSEKPERPKRNKRLKNVKSLKKKTR